MSLTGALNSAVSALSAQSSALSMVSQNLANSNTYGYKTTTASFESLIADSASSAYSAGGVSVTGVSSISSQGSLVSSATSTNMAIEGNGFFVVGNDSANGDIYYSRNGQFTIDKNGYLSNGEYYLQGWPTDAEGTVLGATTTAALQTVDTKAIGSIAAATTSVSLQANLPADAAVGDKFESELEVYDSLGTAATTTVTWTKTAENTWSAAFSNATSADGTTLLGTSPASNTVSISFNSDGTLASTNPNPPTLSFTAWTTGAADSAITLDMGTAGSSSGLSQLSTGADKLSVSLEYDQDGISYGTLTGVELGDDGTVYANYDNDQRRAIYKVAVATFNNADGLTSLSSGVYAANSMSGASSLHVAGTNGAGTISGSMLEASTTDTSQEFSNMMAAQQAYSAAAQVMSSVNTMYDTLLSAMR
jgi:flagellar hook protein FlgE